jgi:hypothetical protein
VPWRPIAEKTGIEFTAFRLYDESGRELPAQVDQIDPANPALDILSFILHDGIAPGPEDYSRSSASVFIAPCEPHEGMGSGGYGASAGRVELTNGRVTISMSLHPSQGDGDWFAGSAQSVRRDNIEMLDIWVSLSGLVVHDPEKRCMQIDRLLIRNPAWCEAPEHEVWLYNRPYQLQFYSHGPAREACTLVSAPFGYTCADPHHKWRTELECTFHRNFAIYRDSDCILEEIWLTGRDVDSETAPTDLRFSARYFANMNMGFEPVLCRCDNVPDWFSVGYPEGWVHPGYGFATDVHVAGVRYPHPGYPDAANAFRTFSWELRSCKRARCMHLFQHDGSEQIEHRTGHAWYEEIYKPLNRVEIHP